MRATRVHVEDVDAGQDDMQIEAVEEGAGDAPTVAVHLVRVAAADACAVAVVAARARA